MPVVSYPTQNIHLPPHRQTLRSIRLFSLISQLIIILVATLLFVDWLFSLHVVTLFLGKTLSNIPTVIVLFTSSITAYLYTKNNKSQLMGVSLLTVIFFLGLISFAIGLSTFLANAFLPLGMVTFLSAVNGKAGLIFFIIGLSIITSTLPIPHRYHFTQFLLAIALFISLFAFLERIYQAVALSNFTGQTVLWDSFLLVILCQSLIFSKPDRGFVGLFTTDSQSSKLARMSFLYFATVPPVLGLFILLIETLSLFDESTRLAIIVILFIMLSTVITWLNTKLLYHSEVEHYLMKESLRVNNISLELNAGDLSSKINQLEKAKKEVAEKLNNQQSLTDVMSKYS